MRRLDRLELRLEELMREQSLRVVSVDLYNRDRAEWERRLAELAQEREDRRTAVREVRADLDAMAQRSGTNIRQAIYSGLVPGILFLISIIITISQGKGGP